jgi:hypothetical protein
MLLKGKLEVILKSAKSITDFMAIGLCPNCRISQFSETPIFAQIVRKIGGRRGNIYYVTVIHAYFSTEGSSTNARLH